MKPATTQVVSQASSRRLAETLRQAIIQGEFVPGQRLSEEAISTRFDTSRNTLREVYRTLATEGLVKHVHNRGVFVTVPSIASIIDIYRVRRLIECQALGQAYPRHPAEKKMKAAVQAAVRCRDLADWAGVGTANMAFHMAVVALADSERLDAMFAPVLAELRLAFGMLQDAEFLHAPYVDMNTRILAMVDADEFVSAASALHEYLVHSERIVLAVYARHVTDVV